jgi:hypothetical protein
VRLDPAQYYADMRDGHDCYSRLNLLVRRKPKENNFKAILETIRDLMNTPALNRAIPSWLHDVFLGYGSPKAANYRYDMPVSIVSLKSSEISLRCSYPMYSTGGPPCRKYSPQ